MFLNSVTNLKYWASFNTKNHIMKSGTRQIRFSVPGNIREDPRISRAFKGYTILNLICLVLILIVSRIYLFPSCF